MKYGSIMPKANSTSSIIAIPVKTESLSLLSCCALINFSLYPGKFNGSLVSKSVSNS